MLRAQGRLETSGLKMHRSGTRLLLAAAWFAAGGSTAFASQSFVSDYSVSLMGLTVATARFESSFDAGRFRIEGRLASAGVARLFDRTTGTTLTEGTIAGDGSVRPRSYSADYVSGRKRQKTTVTFSGGAVSQTRNDPPPRSARRPDWVAVSQADLRAVMDPLSSTLVAAASPAEVCTRTIRMFDGEMRADIRLSPAARGGRDGTVTCNARFVPVSGYREGRRQIDYMKNRSRIAITFAQLGETGIYAPVDATVGTQIGTLRVRAVRIAGKS